MAYTHTERDWLEDAEADEDNGRYLNTCDLCELPFIGHKRRITCKVCAHLPAHGLRDGTYQVWREGICAGFVIVKSRLTSCAPILRHRISYWMHCAKRIGDA